jgi:hypothetical protein
MQALPDAVEQSLEREPAAVGAALALPWELARPGIAE